MTTPRVSSDIPKTYRAIDLKDTLIPKEVRDYLSQFDMYSKNACGISDNQLDPLELTKMMQVNNLNVAIGRFRDQFNDYTLDFEKGQVVYVGSKSTNYDQYDVDVNLMRKFLQLDQILDQLFESISPRLNETDANEFPKFVDEMRKNIRDLLVSNPELIDLDALSEVVEYLGENPEKISDGLIVYDLDHYFKDKYGEEFSAELDFEEEMSVMFGLCEKNSKDNCMQFLILWGMQYEWKYGLNDFMQDAK